MIVTFCGHANCTLTKQEENHLETCLLNIVAKYPCCTFYLGGYGNFDNYCFKLLTKIKLEYPNINRTFITPYIVNSYSKLKNFKQSYDDTIYPPLENVPLRQAINRRNRWMIENVNLLICYIDHTFGGAYSMYKYAINKKLEIINIKTE